MISVPALAAAGATWAAWHDRRVVLAVMTCLLGVFSYVTGFSIGRAFLPAFGRLVWAIVASFGRAMSRATMGIAAGIAE